MPNKNEYPTLIRDAARTLKDKELALEDVKSAMSDIVTPIKYGIATASGRSNEDERSSSLKTALANHKEYGKLLLEKAVLDREVKMGRIDLEYLQNEFIVIQIEAGIPKYMAEV
jgi:hypothetical protein